MLVKAKYKPIQTSELKKINRKKRKLKMCKIKNPILKNGLHQIMQFAHIIVGTALVVFGECRQCFEIAFFLNKVSFMYSIAYYCILDLNVLLFLTHYLVDRHTDSLTEKQTDRQTDKQTDRQIDRQADKQTDIQTDIHRDRQTDTHTDRQTYIQTDRQIYRQTKRQTKRQTVR